jgi:hypothetical protein
MFVTHKLRDIRAVCVLFTGPPGKRRFGVWLPSSFMQLLESRVAEGDSFNLADRNDRHFAKAVGTRTMAAAACDQLDAVTGHRAKQAGEAAALGAYGNDFIDIFAQRVDQTTPVINNTSVHKMV